MGIENEMKTEEDDKGSLSKRHLIFFLALFALIGCAVVRSSISTRLDSFTIDEAYHTRQTPTVISAMRELTRSCASRSW